MTVAVHPVRFRRMPLWQRALPWVIVALMLAPAAALWSATGSDESLLPPPTDAMVQAMERPGETFPGSAFFFAEGAFDPVILPKGVDDGGVHALDTHLTAASPFLFRGHSPLDSIRATNCLTAAIYYEAASESDDGQRAVAQVVLNRVRHPAWPKSVCGVVYEGSERASGCQFSFSCDGATGRQPSMAGWARARRIAVDALSGQVFAPVGLSTHYHTLAVRPFWAASLEPTAVVGHHIFYRWRGAAGQSASFTLAYAGREVQPLPSTRAAVTAQPAAPFLPFLPRAGSAAQPAPYPVPTTPSGAQLPDSQIRPEYRNSGQPLL